MEKNYYIGLDIGTNSVGWAVTDEKYSVVKKKGKRLWGVRLFDTAATAKKRRLKRTARRRYLRRRQRIDLLQELFAPLILERDENFFRRLDESFFFEEDKKVDGKYSLFSDKNYTDKDFYKEYKTAYHLRNRLIKGDIPDDPRIVYLACHHIIKKRGHFLFNGEINGNNISCVNEIRGLQKFVTDGNDHDVPMFGGDNFKDFSLDEFVKIITLTDTRRESIEKTTELFGVSDGKYLKNAVRVIFGYKQKVKTLFASEYYGDCDIEIDFTSEQYEETSEALKIELGDDYSYVDTLKNLYDFVVLKRLLQEHSSISEAMVSKYERHAVELRMLKNIVRKYGKTSDYNEIFKETVSDASYAKYIGMNKKGGVKQVTERESAYSYETFYKALLGKLDSIVTDKSDADYLCIKNRIENKDFLIRYASSVNASIPNQLHRDELNRILDNASVKFPYLLEKDGDGLSVKDKIMSIMTYKIPYYVGPIPNDENSEAIGKYSWLVRKESGKVLPWNFEKKVDMNASMEKFIKSLINRCSYLNTENVLPKQSLIYQEYEVLNELNGIKFNGKRIDNETKLKIFEGLFKNSGKKKITEKILKAFLVNENVVSKSDINALKIDGYQKDKEFSTCLSSYVNIVKALGNDFDRGYVDNNIDTFERIIELSTVYADNKSLFVEKLKQEFPALDERVIAKVKGLTFTKWGRLSKRLLVGVVASNTATGEVSNILSLMRNTNANFMEIIFDKEWNFNALIEEENKSVSRQIDKIKYSDIAELYCSPSVKRAIWQSIKIVREIVEIMGYPPTKFFVEVTRSDEDKKRTSSRKSVLQKLYKGVDDSGDIKAIKEALEKENENSLKDERLYLYYSQQGKCMYTGKPINIDDLLNTKLYDIDHIYPQSMTTDESVHRNKVLVCRSANKDKSDVYPLNIEVQNKMAGFWKSLRDKEFITPEKYIRLTRKEPLTDKELGDFIARQLVFTSQSVKEVINLLKIEYPNSETCYVKAEVVKDFRSRNNYLKIRTLNDLHHAKDAYLNVVAGNILSTANKNNFRMQRINKGNEIDTDIIKNYSISNIFSRGYVVSTAKNLAWNCDLFDNVEKQYYRNDILVTKMQTVGKGAFYDETVRKSLANAKYAKAARKASIPLKKVEGNRYSIERYGGVTTVSPRWFALIGCSDKKNNQIYRIEPITIYDYAKMDKSRIKDEMTSLLERQGHKNVDIIAILKKNTLLSIDGNRYYLTGTSGESLTLDNAKQLTVGREYELAVNRILKYTENPKRNKDVTEVAIRSKSKEDYNIDEKAVFVMLVDKLKTEFPQFRVVASKFDDESIKAFDTANKSRQCEIITNIINMMGCNSTRGKLDGEPFNANFKASEGALTANKKVSYELTVIDQSVTGVYEYSKSIKK